jgi:hypothetical protein
MSDISAFADVRTALRTQLLTVVGLPAARKWDGESLDPPSSAPYIRETLLRKAPAIARSLGDKPGMELKVIYQVDYFMPATDVNGVGQDATVHELAAGAIKAAFPTSVGLAFNGVRLQITRAGMTTIEEDTPHNKIAVEIYATARWYADV